MDRVSLLLNTIQNNPGIHVREIMKQTGLENGVVIYHLDKMEKKGVVKTQKYSRHKRYYPADVFEEEFSIIRNLRKPTKKEILFKIIVHGNPSFQELKSKIDKSPGTLSWNLSELIKEGIIEKCRKDGKQCYRVINKELLKKTFKKEFSKLLDDKFDHSEDIFLAL